MSEYGIFATRTASNEKTFHYGIRGNELFEERSFYYTDKKGNHIIRATVKGRGIKVVLDKNDPNFIITVADY